MQATKLWIGTDYAFGYRRKGAPLPLDAERAKLLEVIKKRNFNNKKDSTYARVQRLLDNGLPNPNYPEPITVKARDILEFWDEYFETIEEDRVEAKRKEEEERIRAEERNAVYYVGSFLRNTVMRWEREDRIQKQREEAEAREKRLTRVRNVMITRGFQRDKIAVTEYTVTMQLEEMERWLGFEQHST